MMWRSLAAGGHFALRTLAQKLRPRRASFVRHLMFEGLVHRLTPDDGLRNVPVEIVWHARPSARVRYLAALTRSVVEQGK
jgi:hypothetical protein